MIGSRATYEQAVLFVHGIGNQQQGDTLVRWGDALSGWLDEWGNRGEDSIPVRFSDVVLHPTEGAPAHGDLHLGYGDDRVSWLIEEVWWADEIQTPSYPKLAAFTIQALPLTLFSFVGGAIRRHRLAGRDAGFVRKSYHWAWVALSILVGLPLTLAAAPLVASLMVTLLVVGLIPVPGVRSRVLAVQRALSVTVGDSMILLGSPTQRAAMTSRVIEAVRFARARGVNRITIVAHSQGAAIVKRALAEQPPFVPKPRLVTVGSGINRLDELEHEGKAKAWLAPAGFAVAAGFGTLLYLLERAGEISWGQVAAWGGGYFATFLGIATLEVVARRWWLRAKDGKPASEKLVKTVAWILTALFVAAIGVITLSGDAAIAVRLPAAALGAGYVAMHRIVFSLPAPVTPSLEHRVDSWLDLYSTADPVPNGPTRTNKADWPVSIEVANAHSLAFDHVRYERERDDAMALITQFLLRDTPGPIRVSDADGEHIERVRRSRRRRVAVLSATRWLVAAAAAAFAALRTDDIRSWAIDGYDWWGENLGLPLWWPTSVSGDTALAVGLTGLGAVAAAVYGVLSRVWAIWNSIESRTVFGPQAEPEEAVEEPDEKGAVGATIRAVPEPRSEPTGSPTSGSSIDSLPA